MNLLDSLLDAIVRLDGDALVMHVGEKPYVVTTSEGAHQFRGPLAWGQVELSSRVLTPEAVSGMLGQILPLDQRSALDEYGATDYDVNGASGDEHFTIVAARGGDDIWLEVRRHPKHAAGPVAAAAPEPAAAVPVGAAAAPASSQPVEHADVPEPVLVSRQAIASEPMAAAGASEVEELPLVVDIDEPEPEIAEAPAHWMRPAEKPAVTAVEEPEAVSIGEAPHTAEAEVDIDLGAEFELEFDTEPAPLAVEEIPPSIAASDKWFEEEVSTDGDLGELLRASAAAIITGESEPLPAALTGDSTFDEQPVAIDVAEPVADAVAFEAPIEHHAPEPAPFQPVHHDRLQKVTAELPALVEYQRQHDRVVAETTGPAPDSEPEYQLDLDHGPVAAAPVEEIAASSQVAELIDSTDRGVAEYEVAMSDAQNEQDEPAAAEPLPLVVMAPVEPVAAGASSPEEHHAAVTDEATGAGVGTPRLAEDAAAAGAPAPTGRSGATVVPLGRQPRPESTNAARASLSTTLQRLLRLAATRGAATVYVVAQTPPMVRVDGEFSTLEGEPALSAAFVERLLAEVAPATRESAAAAAEWLIDVPEIGRVRCVTFRDHRGPGVIFRMVPPRAISAEQLGLSSEVQALCSEADGLVLVTGGRGSGKSTLLTSFVDLINRTRSDYVITVESQIEFVHENRRSFISQREVRGDESMLTAVRAACREEPDVLVVEDVRTQELAALTLEAAESGRLVFASVPGIATTSAVERLIELFPAERREKVQASLASTLRGMVSQVLLRKLRGGRVAAREVLLNTPAVASLISEGKTFQLPASLESGKRAGMISFAESLAGLVRDGNVHPAHAHRKAPNREQFLAALRRDGVDPALVERPA